MRDRSATWASDLAVTWLVGVGVLLAGIFDWSQGQPPASLLELPAIPGFALFGASVVMVVGLASMASLGRAHRRWYLEAGAIALLAVVVADPTYASLLALVPLIEIRRRAEEPLRLWLTVGALAVLAGLLLTEQTQRVNAEIEAMFVIVIAVAMTVGLGNALRRMDAAHALAAEGARADERSRLARDLHDSLGHNLLACSVQLRNAAAQLSRDREATARAIDLASRAVAEALADTRLSVDTVRADNAGFSLTDALPELVQRATPTSMTVRVDVEGEHRALDQLTQMTLYRVAQEALTNIVRHANATGATIRSTVTDTDAVLEIRDDGDGFDPSSTVEGGASGLQSLQDRLARIGGTLQVRSEKGHGTTLTAVVAR
ncbi:MAG: sensor histidine kinase [Actinomycetota bacterium]